MRLPSLTEEMRRCGWSPSNPLPLERLYAANSLTRDEWDAWRDEEAWREKARARDEAARRRRLREDRMAAEWEASHAAR